MPRNEINELVQFAKEVTPGTMVATNLRFTSTNITPDDQVEISENPVMGYKYDTGYNVNKEWMEWNVDGTINFNEMKYHLDSLVKLGVHTALTGADTGAHEWLYDPSTFTPETIATYTFANGVPGATDAGERCGYNHMIGMELTYDRDAIQLGGKYRGRELQYPHTVETASVNEVPDIRAFPGDIDIFVDEEKGDLGTSKLLTSYAGAWRLNDRRGIAWTLNSALNSWAHAPETKPTAEFAVTIEDDATAKTWITYSKAQTPLWFRLLFTGPVIVDGGSAPYILQFDMPCKVKARPAPSGVQGIKTREFTFGLIHDSTWGKAYSILLRNTVAS